jgi:hypothetical protein
MLAERFSIATDILDSTIGQQLNQWVQNFSGTGEEFAAGMTAWLAGMKVIDTIEFDDPAMTKLMEEFFTGLMTSVDPEQFLPAAEAFAKLAAVFDFDVMAEGARMFEEANMSAWDSLLTLKDGVWDAINTFDGTVESIQRLADATGNFKAAAAQMIAAISAIQQKISETTAGTIEQMRTSMMGDEEKANYFIDEANRLKTDLATMTDPAEIESTVAKINELVLGAFNTLPEEMRASFLAWAEPFLLDTEDLANKRLEAAKEEIGTMTTAIEGAIVSGLGKVAADFQAAANTMNQAAANIPREIDANVSVTVNNTGNTGMAYGEIGY